MYRRVITSCFPSSFVSQPKTCFLRHCSSTTQAHKKEKIYDLVVIGSGPSATQCAYDAAKKGHSVAIVDKSTTIGGACVHTGTIPSKTFREAVLHFTGYRHQGIYGQSYSFAQKVITIHDILQRVRIVIDSEVDALSARLAGHGVEFINGHAVFENENTVIINDKDKIHGKQFLIACGTRPAHDPEIHCDGKVIMDSDQILAGEIHRVPQSLIVVGAGVIGMEYASMINVLPGTQVTVIDTRPEILSFADREIISMLQYGMAARGARFLLGESLQKVEKTKKGVKVSLASGKVIQGNALLYAVGRQANTEGLNLEAVGLEKNKRGLLTVNEYFQTSQPHIYAAGDCIGPPSLASTSMEQGRLASCHMWTKDAAVLSQSQLHSGNFPYGIYTIPEISMVGSTEEELTAKERNYSVGIAKYSELAKGQMMGGSDQIGLLKILFDVDTLEVLGVHAIGDGATEIIHIGQAAMDLGCTLEYFRDAVFNYPTLAEAYRVAALNGLGYAHIAV